MSMITAQIYGPSLYSAEIMVKQKTNEAKCPFSYKCLKNIKNDMLFIEVSSFMSSVSWSYATFVITVL